MLTQHQVTIRSREATEAEGTQKCHTLINVLLTNMNTLHVLMSYMKVAAYRYYFWWTNILYPRISRPWWSNNFQLYRGFAKHDAGPTLLKSQNILEPVGIEPSNIATQKTHEWTIGTNIYMWQDRKTLIETQCITIFQHEAFRHILLPIRIIAMETPITWGSCVKGSTNVDNTYYLWFI